MTKNFSSLRRNNLNLLAVFFIFGAFALGCNNCNFSIGNPPVSELEAETIAFKTLQNFNRALQRGDFREFQQTEVADAAKAEMTVEAFDRAFTSFVRRRVNITPKAGAKINWSPKPETVNGFLKLNGNYPATDGRTVNFQMEYIKEAGDWGLKAIDFDIH